MNDNPIRNQLMHNLRRMLKESCDDYTVLLNMKFDQFKEFVNENKDAFAKSREILHPLVIHEEIGKVSYLLRNTAIDVNQEAPGEGWRPLDFVDFQHCNKFKEKEKMFRLLVSKGARYSERFRRHLLDGLNTHAVTNYYGRYIRIHNPLYDVNDDGSADLCRLMIRSGHPITETPHEYGLTFKFMYGDDGLKMMDAAIRAGYDINTLLSDEHGDLDEMASVRTAYEIDRDQRRENNDRQPDWYQPETRFDKYLFPETANGFHMMEYRKRQFHLALLAGGNPYFDPRSCTFPLVWDNNGPEQHLRPIYRHITTMEKKHPDEYKHLMENPPGSRPLRARCLQVIFRHQVNTDGIPWRMLQWPGFEDIYEPVRPDHAYAREMLEFAKAAKKQKQREVAAERKRKRAKENTTSSKRSK